MVKHLGDREELSDMGQSANSSLASKMSQMLAILPHSFIVNQSPRANILFVVGYLLLVICCWLFVVGYLLLVICCWLFVVGYLLLVICCWLFVAPL